ncbi:hypothetical protein ACHQM5_003167 [Ranunculus cassubicifolius]
MAKKRKSVATHLDEVDRTMYTTFCTAANSISQLYTQAMNQQNLAFQAGERHALEKLYQCILQQQEEGSRVMTSDIVSYLQNELDCGGEEPPMIPSQNLFPHQPTMHTAQDTFNSLGATVLRPDNVDHQPKNMVFANVQASPVRQHCHLLQGGNDSSMDMKF